MESKGSHELEFMNSVYEDSCAVQMVGVLDPGESVSMRPVMCKGQKCFNEEVVLHTDFFPDMYKQSLREHSRTQCWGLLFHRVVK